jgi:pimeloyl-ACP methyl ester carboxylesterase
MECITSRARATVSYESYGDGPPLVLIHGSFSDHRTNWQFVRPFFEKQFTVYAVARRGRGDTDATESHNLEAEGLDVVGVVEAIGGPVFLLGHSYGGHVALAAATTIPDRIRKLVLYEPPSSRIRREVRVRLEDLARDENWDAFALTFFRDHLSVPVSELDALRATDLWPPIVADGKASLQDLRALCRYNFHAERFRELRFPVVLQIGTESPRDLYVTDELAALLPVVRIQELSGQAHEGMTTAPEMYAEAVRSVLLS